MGTNLRIIPLLDNKPSELAWIRSVFGTGLQRYQADIPVHSGALYLFNSIHQLNIDPDLLMRIEAAGGCGLFHAGDEYFRGGYDTYAAFDYVIRNYENSALEGRGVLTIPTGFTPHFGNTFFSPASQRKYNWMFAGAYKADRAVMAKQFNKIPGGFLSLPVENVVEQGLSINDYASMMSQAKFAPCPSGNIMLETVRVYEALQLGTIPLLPVRKNIDVFRSMLGDHPLPSFPNWASAREFAQKMCLDSVGLDQLQAECVDWWEGFKPQLSKDVAAFIQAGQSGAFRGDLKTEYGAFKTSQFARLRLLLDQQNADQLRQRAAFTLRSKLGRYVGLRPIQQTWSLNN